MPRATLFLTIALVCSAPWNAALSAPVSFEMQLHADNDSRWFDLWSQAFFELGSVWEVRDGITGEVVEIQSPQRDGAFALSAEGVVPSEIDLFDPFTFVPTVYAELGRRDEGYGDTFINENNFSNSYSVAYDDAGITGVGTETAAITGFDLDFVQDVANDDVVFGVGYETATSNALGVVTLIDGEVASIEGSSSISFTFDTSASPIVDVGYLVYHGLFTVSGGAWGLAVDDEDNDIFAYRLAWDLHGQITNLATEPDVLDADFNNDGLVDAADYSVWRDNLGAAGLIAYELGDADGDGQVTIQDYQAWRSLYGTEQPTGLNALRKGVPEPSGTATLALVAVVLSRVRSSLNRQSRHPVVTEAFAQTSAPLYRIRR